MRPGGQPAGPRSKGAPVELVNEDSFFFWTFSQKNIPAAQWAKLEEQYGHWLNKRHGSIDKAVAQEALNRREAGAVPG